MWREERHGYGDEQAQPESYCVGEEEALRVPLHEQQHEDVDGDQADEVIGSAPASREVREG